MQSIPLDFTGMDTNGGFYITPGTYRGVCKSVKKDRKPGGDYDYLEWAFDLEDNGHVMIMDKTSLSPKARFHIYGLLNAFAGKTIPTAIKLDPDKFIGRSVMLTIVDDTYNGNVSSKVKRYLPVSAVTVARKVTASSAPATQETIEDDEELPF